jgi:hypothetical protein
MGPSLASKTCSDMNFINCSARIMIYESVKRFEALEYHQGVSIRYERVEASNSCAKTLIFNSFSFFAVLSVFFLFIHPFSLFYALVFLPFLLSFPFLFVFLLPFIPPSPLFFTLVLSLFFLLMWVSSIAYPNLFGTKKLVVVQQEL